MPELGKKHECSECGAKFYDLGKPDPACPRCGVPLAGNQEEQSKPKARRKPKKEQEPKSAPAAEPQSSGDATTGELDEDSEDSEDSETTFGDLDDEDLDDEDLEGLDDDDFEDDDEDDDDDDPEG